MQANSSLARQFGIPPLVLGDHGFLRKYGSRLSHSEIRQRMEHAVAMGITGLSAGDERVLSVATALARSSTPQLFVMFHTDVRFRAGARQAHFGRCMATIGRAVREVSPEFLECDPLMGHFLNRYSHFRSYAATEDLAPHPDADARAVAAESTYHPSAISIGGDYLDTLHVLGRLDVAREAVRRLAEPLRSRGRLVVLTSYVLGVARVEYLGDLLEDVDALMVPLNLLGRGMCPSEPRLRQVLADLGKPVIAMHALASGRLEPGPALAYVFDEVGAMSAVVGASAPKHIDALACATSHLDGSEVSTQ